MARFPNYSGQAEFYWKGWKDQENDRAMEFITLRLRDGPILDPSGTKQETPAAICSAIGHKILGPSAGFSTKLIYCLL